jgi:hypothetical protein
VEGVNALAEGHSPYIYSLIIFTSILNKSIKGVGKMNVLRELEGRIETTVGEEQRYWVKKYEEYLSVEINLDVIRKSSEKNPICYSDNGEIKYKSYSEEEKEKILIELEELKLKIEKNLN